MKRRQKKQLISVAEEAFKMDVLVTVKFKNGKTVECNIRDIDEGSFLAEHTDKTVFHAEWRNVESIA